MDRIGKLNILDDLDPPIMNAAGTLQPEALDDVRGVYGAVVTKTITLAPRIGNPPPRLAETPSGMINTIGLQNPGIERFLQEELNRWCVGLPVIVSVGGTEQWHYYELAIRVARDERVAAIELNLSCPNTASRRTFSEYPNVVGGILLGIRDRLDKPKPIIVKLSLTNCAQSAQVAAGAGASAVTLINTIPAYSRQPRAAESVIGGLSGPAIKPIALRAVYEVAQVVDTEVTPLIGCGGISCGADIREFMKAGASAVQIGSGSFVRDAREIVREWEEEK